MYFKSVAREIVAVLSLLTALCYSFPANNGTHIIGADDVTDTLPYHVEFVFDLGKEEYSYCYGIFIDMQYIAAPLYDCLINYQHANRTFVYQTAIFKDRFHMEFEADRTVQHDKYKESTLKANIGLLILKIAQNVQLPKYMKYDQHLSHGKVVQTYGFGSVFALENNRMKYATSMTIMRKTAKTVFGYDIYVHKKSTLALELIKEAAISMDTGSPIIHKTSTGEMKVVGLIAYSKDNEWNDKVKSAVVLGIEICRKEIATFLRRETYKSFGCVGQKL